MSRPSAAASVHACLVLALALGAGACGAMFNGLESTVTIRSKTPGAQIFLNGGLVQPPPGQETGANGTIASFLTTNQIPQTVLVKAPGHRDKELRLEPKVTTGPVVMDILWSLTIIGVAAPISDLVLGTFVKLAPNDIEVTLEPGTPAPFPVAATWGAALVPPRAGNPP